MVMSLVDAVDSKFTMLKEADFPNIHVAGSPGKTGSGRLILPHIMIMDDCCVEVAGEEEKLREMLKDVVELDLGKNRLCSWVEVIKIIRCLPSVESINLNLNRLGDDPYLPDWSIGGSPSAHMGNLRTVILNSTSITWSQVFALLPGLPRLQELHLGMNDFEEVAESDANYPNVRILYFNGNKLVQFDQLENLGRLFPGMEQLFLISNYVKAIGSPEEVSPVFSALPNLSYLNLSKNRLSNWSCIDQLRHLPALTDLRIGGNPLFEDWSEDECRIHVVARLPNVVRLNGSAIDENEREDAERAFIRHFMDQEDRPERYMELEERHGRLQPLAQVNLSPRKMVNFVVRFGEHSLTHNLNIDQTVGSAKRELCSLFNINPANTRFFYIDQETVHVMGRDELRYSSRGLHSYRPEEGDELILELKPGCE